MTKKNINLKIAKRLFALLVLSFLVSPLFAQTNYNQGNIKQKSYFQKIPYQKVREMLIVVPVTIDGKIYRFMLDTGAPLYISHKLYMELNLQIIGQTKVSDASGTVKDMNHILLPELDLQGITFVNTPGIVDHENSFFLECLGVDGFIGSNMLRNSVIQFDDHSGHIIITNDIKELSVKNTVRQKVTLTRIQSSPYIVVGLKKGDKKVGDRVLFDTGAASFYDMAVGVYNRVNDRAEILDKIAEGEGSFSFGAHGASESQQHLLLNIPELLVAKTTFSNVAVTATSDSRSRIGSKLIQYGIVTLDYKKRHFYFEPFDDINTNELSEKTRQIGFTISNDKLVVGIIWDKALASQVNLGDEVLSVNGLDYQQMDVCELFNSTIVFSRMATLIVELRDKNTEEIKKVEIKRL